MWATSMYAERLSSKLLNTESKDNLKLELAFELLRFVIRDLSDSISLMIRHLLIVQYIAVTLHGELLPSVKREDVSR